MLRSLNQIFPVDYPQIPTIEDLKFEVQDMLRHCETANMILHYLQQIKCPYYQVIEQPPERYIPKFYKHCTIYFWCAIVLLLLYIVFRITKAKGDFVAV